MKLLLSVDVDIDVADFDHKMAKANHPPSVVEFVISLLWTFENGTDRRQSMTDIMPKI